MSSVDRLQFRGALQVVRFNWPWYLLALLAVVALATCGFYLAAPLGTVCATVAFLIAAQSVASVLASYWIYDRSSELIDWIWVGKIEPPEKRLIVNVHSGYDQTGSALARLFPEARITSVNLYDSLGEKREASIERAADQDSGGTDAISTELSGWPLADASVDLVLLAMAAHEVRDRANRQELFAEVSRVLAPDGRAVVVEHLRDLPNLLVFGPGFLHFLSLKEWLASTSALQLSEQFSITPFVKVLVLCNR